MRGKKSASEKKTPPNTMMQISVSAKLISPLGFVKLYTDASRDVLPVKGHVGGPPLCDHKGDGFPPVH